jgi:hypothetical protein
MMKNKYSESFTGRKIATTFAETWEFRIDNLNGISYTDFLQSDYWKSIKEKAKRRPHLCKCFFCEETNNLHLHHTHYDLINTKHELMALMALCSSHHNVIHTYAKKYNISIRASTRTMRRVVKKMGFLPKNVEEITITPKNKYLAR